MVAMARTPGRMRVMMSIRFDKVAALDP